LTIEALKEAYPKIYKTVPDDVTEFRHLLVIDINYDDDDSDVFDGIDPEDYNFLLYVTEILQEAVSEPVMIELVKKLKVHKDIDAFHLSEIDLYGIQTNLDQEAIGHMVMSTLEEILV